MLRRRKLKEWRPMIMIGGQGCIPGRFGLINMGNSPATVHRQTGVVYLHPRFHRFPESWQTFILYHEMGHYVLKTTSEKRADAYAFKRYAPEGWPLTDALLAQTQILDEDNAKHDRRVRALRRLIYDYDYRVNGNPRAYLGK